MKPLIRWFQIVGAVYILLGIGFFPPINAARLPFMIPVDVGAETIAYKALVDWTFFFGLDMLIIGVFMVYAARKPAQALILAWLVIWLELVRGVFADIYYILRGYASVPVYVGFMVFHLIIILTGIRAIRAAESEGEPA